MIELIREWFELRTKQNWLKHIDKELKRYNRLIIKAEAQSNVVHYLVERYKGLYPGNEIREKQNGTGSDAVQGMES